MKSAVLKFLFFLVFIALSTEAREINLNSTLQKANNSQKHLFVFLHRTDCGYCESMIQFTFEDEIIKSYISKNFIYEHINVKENDTVTYESFKGNGREFAKHVGYDFYPTCLFFNSDGELVFVEVGYIDKKSMSNEDRFYKILKYVNSKSYKEMEFDVSK